MIEVLVAVTLMLAAIGGMLGVLGTSKRVSTAAQRRALAASVAQRELDKMNAVGYDDLMLSGPAQQATKSDDVTANDDHPYSEPSKMLRVEDCVPCGGFRWEPVVEQDGGTVDPKTTLTVNGVEATIWRYVTWHDDGCQAAVCSGHDTKRLLVAVRLAPTASQQITEPIWLSTFASDDVGDSASGPILLDPSGDKNKTKGLFYLHDAPCFNPGLVGARPTHDTDNTAAYDPNPLLSVGDPVDRSKYALCSTTTMQLGNPITAPNLMDSNPPVANPPSSESSSTIPSQDYCDDQDGPTPYPCRMVGQGSALLDSDACQPASTDYPYPWSYAGSGTNTGLPNRWNMHAWSTVERTSDLNLTGLVELSLNATTLNGEEGIVRLCAYLVDRNQHPNGASGDVVPDDTLIAAFHVDRSVGAQDDFDQTGAYAHFTARASFPGTYKLATGHHLVLVLAVRADSAGNGVSLGYAFPNVPSSLYVDTTL